MLINFLNIHLFSFYKYLGDIIYQNSIKFNFIYVDEKTIKILVSSDWLGQAELSELNNQNCHLKKSLEQAQEFHKVPLAF